MTSRPLTLEEIRSHGIIVDGSSTRAYNFTFGFGVEGNTVDYNVPIVYWYPAAGASRFPGPRGCQMR